ncbi:MAG: gluconolaconase, partial [Rhodospirillaceae bacterium]|nr:gluconolaconase [Rhodospirillaceae bacterium]
MTQTKRRLTFVLAVTTLGLFGCDEPPETWRTETVVTGLPVHGVHGLAFGPDGDLYIGSVMGQSIVRLDVETGLMEDVVGAPLGEADDVAFGPDGSMAWTALNQGELRLKENDGTIRTVATD